MKNKILISGAAGFIGSQLVKHLLQKKHLVKSVIREKKYGKKDKTSAEEICKIIEPMTPWGEDLRDVNTVIHLAARVHIMNDKASNPIYEFRKSNTLSTLNFAEQAANAGVRRFIFLSSIKVNGENTFNGNYFHSIDNPEPQDPYSKSKYSAEQGLLEIAKKTGLEVVIIRPPLVYGPNVKGNFCNMMKWLQKGIPLPLGAIHNQRSLIALANLIDLITTCIDHPAAAGQTFLVSDGEDLSTTKLLRRLGLGLGKPARLLPVPQIWLETSLNLIGKQAIAQRLCGNLQIDISRTREILNWSPPVRVDDALQQTAQAWLTQQNR